MSINSDNKKKQTLLIKISGESFKGTTTNVDPEKIDSIALQIKELQKKYNVGVVIGGGNIIRGAKWKANQVRRTTADQMGMMATNINCLALRDTLQSYDVKTIMYTLIPMPSIAHTYSINDMLKNINEGNVIIFAAGTGNPYFSTDTGIALRTLETDADIVLMGKTGVDGIYSSDPRIDANAERFEKISFDQTLEKNLQVMDQTAVCLMRNSHAKILVFNANRKNCYIDVMEEKIPYTIVYSKDEVK